MAQAKGYGERHAYNAPLGTETFVFRSDGIVPNNTLPLIVRRGAIPPSADDPTKAFEATFAKNGWTNAWRDGILDYHHYHSTTHEVLGVASGSGQVRFGGEGGELVAVTAGDVVIVPAGVAHALINAATTSPWSAPIRTARDYEMVRGRPQAPCPPRSSASPRCPCRACGPGGRRGRAVDEAVGARRE